MRTSLLTLWLVFAIASVSQAQAPALRYDWKPNQQFAYEATITVETPQAVETYKGIINYTVKTVEKDSRLVVYNGGLHKTTKEKETERPRGFGPRFRVPGPPPSPFARNNFRGSEQTTNELTISALGNVSQMKGDSQLPYLLGNVSTLPFETLPPQAQKEWKVEGGTSITEKEDRTDGRFGRFGGFGPFGGQGDEDKAVQSASETTSYAISAEQGEVVTIKKTYQLKSPAPKAGEQGFEMTGSGTWKFDRKLNIPDSLHMEQKLLVNADNQQITVPITVDYRRLTDDELAKINADRQRMIEEAKARHEANMRAQAEAKRLAEQPLTGDEKQTALATLKSNDTDQQIKTLEMLAKKTLVSPDADVAAVIEGLLKHDERTVREAAHKALLHWSLSYKPREELDKQYNSPHGVSSTARAVTSNTPLYVGQIVQLKDNNRWLPADVLELQSDGKVKVHPRGWNTPAWDKAVARDQLQLAPDELFQPAKSPTAVTALASEMRTWSDRTGTHKIEATYQGVADGKVLLKRKDSKELKVALDSLSKADQDYVAELQKAAALPPNPFEQ